MAISGVRTVRKVLQDEEEGRSVAVDITSLPCQRSNAIGVGQEGILVSIETLKGTAGGIRVFVPIPVTEVGFNFSALSLEAVIPLQRVGKGTVSPLRGFSEALPPATSICLNLVRVGLLPTLTVSGGIISTSTKHPAT